MDHDECRDCGALVASMTNHKRWHKRFEEAESLASEALATAEEARETADGAANVLYQNNITV